MLWIILFVVAMAFVARFVHNAAEKVRREDEAPKGPDMTE